MRNTVGAALPDARWVAQFIAKRFEDLPSEQLLFNEIEKEAALAEKAGATETITYTRKRGRGKRKAFPAGMAREEKIIDLPEEQKTCPHDGRRLEKIGEERVEKLKTELFPRTEEWTSVGRS